MSDHLCPSAECEDGSILLGVIQPDGTVGYLGGGLTIDESFVARAQRGRDPKRRFRFANSCVEGQCSQWTGTRCGVIDRVVDLAEPESDALPACGIRAQCRWFSQSGVEACGVCPLVITDVTPE